MTAPGLDPALSWALRLALALLFAAAAWHKARQPAGFRAALKDYRILPSSVCGGAAALLVACEIGVAVGLAIPSSGAAPAFGAALLLLLYSVAIAINLRRGRRAIDCGCAGPAGRRSLSGGLVVRNALVMAVALLAALPVAARSLVWVDALTLAAGVTALALVYAALDVALANAPKLRRKGGHAWSTP